jgi:hypothetical protein
MVASPADLLSCELLANLPRKKVCVYDVSRELALQIMRYLRDYT